MDRIEKSIDLKAPIERVWRAVTDHEEFGTWFGVKLGSPFAVGETARGRITHPGYEHVVLAAKVVDIDRPRRFAFTWHPHAVDPAVDYSAEPSTLVEFTLEPIATGTRLTIVESGFEALPKHRLVDALPRNAEGWSTQIENIRTYVER
jgi:uncharacterized protein YndB with AHSA1/START domain